MSSRTLARILEKNGFRIFGIDAYKRECNGCPEPYTRRYVWVRFRDDIIVSHSVHVRPDKIVQLTLNQLVHSGVEMLAAIGQEQTRTDHVEWEEGESGAQALSRQRNRLRFPSVVREPGAWLRPHDHLNPEVWRERPPK